MVGQYISFPRSESSSNDCKQRFINTKVEQTGADVAPAPRSRFKVWYKAFANPVSVSKSIVLELKLISNGTARRFS